MAAATRMIPQSAKPVVSIEAGWAKPLSDTPDYAPHWQDFKIALHRRLSERINLQLLSAVSEHSRAETRNAIATLVDKEAEDLDRAAKDRLVEELLEELLGLGLRC